MCVCVCVVCVLCVVHLLVWIINCTICTVHIKIDVGVVCIQVVINVKLQTGKKVGWEKSIKEARGPVEIVVPSKK